jgi:rhodanese-related sulfurtransferase
MTAGNGLDDLEISVQQYLNEWQDTPHQLIDVREQDEWDAGHVATATLIPLGEFAERSAGLDPSVPVAIICRSGRRSLMAAEFLADQGFTTPVSVAGGMIAWAEAGQPVAR